MKRKGPQPPTISVCFIDNTANGILVRRMQGVEDEVGSKVDYRVRMTEAAGTPMSLLLTNNNPWGTKDCQREDCQTCAQGDEKQIDCKKRNVLYESFCTLCNPGELKRGKKDEIAFLKEGRGIYVGESSRSMYERTGEHVADRVSRKEESHQIKHWLLDHAELVEPPKFKFRLVKSFKDPMSRQLAEAVRIELRGNDILNSKAEFNRSRVPRLRVDMEGWKQAQKKEPTSLLEESGEVEYETSIEEKAMKRKVDEEAENKHQKKPKRMKLDKLEGWGESMENTTEENLPEGWWQTMNYIETNSGVKKDLQPPKDNYDKEEDNKFKFKKSGKLNKAEVKELKRTCKSILSWVKLPTLPPPLPSTPTTNTAQEGTEDMEWDEIGREERLEMVRSKKEKWELARMMNMITMEVVEKAASWSENYHVINILEDTLQEGWRRVETTRILGILTRSEKEIQARVLEACLLKKEEERILLAALGLEEEKQRRLERTRILKKILGRKLGAINLRKVIRMMNLMTIDDLEMEVEEVEAKAMEMMETDRDNFSCEMTDDAPSNQFGERMMYDDISNQQQGVYESSDVEPAEGSRCPRRGENRKVRQH